MSFTILNFHGVGPITRPIDDGELDCWLDEANFEAVLDLARGQPHIRLTVDDGNASDYEFILPSLLRRGLTATFFVCTELLDQPTFLRRQQVQELQANGMTIGSHGTRHRPWTKLSPPELIEELAGSRASLEALCGRIVDTAACPFGAYDRTVLQGLRQAGYHKVYTSDKGAARQADWLSARNTVNRSTPLAEIHHLIHQGPDCLTQSWITTRKIIKSLK